jgi:hypothetical protein
MNLLSFLTKKRTPANGFQSKEATPRPPLKAFILESILTPGDILGTGDTPQSVILDLQAPPLPDIPEFHIFPDADPHLDTTADSIPLASIDHLPFINPDITPDLHTTFTSGTFTVGETGAVSVDYLFDGGGYQGEVAIFSLDGIDQFEPGSTEFIQEAARRALSDSLLGHIVISDATEKAHFDGLLGEQSNWNFGEYAGVKTVAMRPGDTFGIILVPNGTISQIWDHPDAQGDLRPLFSLVTANPHDAFHVGQVADVTGDGHTFVLEDLRVDTGTDRDYNDIIFQIKGATGKAELLDNVIDPLKDWRHSDLGHEILTYITAEDTHYEDHSGDILEHTKPDLTDNSDPDHLNLFGGYQSDTTGGATDSTASHSEPFNVGGGNITTTEISVGGGNTASNPTLDWVHEFGTAASDRARGVTFDHSGNIYVVGATDAALDGHTNTYGNPDPFITKYDTYGNKLWTHQLGTADWDFHTSAAVDGSNNLYTSGYHHTDYANDSTVAKWDSNGNLLWSRTINSSFDDWSSDIATDNSGNVYVTGYTAGSLGGYYNAGSTDAFVTKYDAYGNQIWARLLGTGGHDEGRSVTTDLNGNIYVAGVTEGSLDGNTNAGGTDVFVTKYNSQGTKLWTHQLGSSGDEGNVGFEVTGTSERNVSVATDSAGNLYVSGRTTGYLDGNANAGGSDVFLTKYDVFGNKVWTKEFGGVGNEYSTGVSVDTTGNIYVSGATTGSLDGNGNAGGFDSFITKFDSNGNKLATKLLGSTADDFARDIAVDNLGNIVIAGYTAGSLAETNAGSNDIFVAKYLPFQPNRPPVVNVTNSNQTVVGKHSITPSFSVTDADGDAITSYRFWDSNTSSSSGYFTVNGVQQAAGQAIEVAASQLGSVKFVGGTTAGNDSVYVQAYDGKAWSNWTGFNAQTTKANSAPALSAIAQTVNTNQSITPSFSVTDADGDPILQYAFYDGNTSTTSGYFTVNGVKQAAGQTFLVAANQLSTVKFVGGSVAGDDQVYFTATDGYDWGSWASANIKTQKVNTPPVVSASNQLVRNGQPFAPAFTVTDVDGDAITQYAFLDNNTSSTSGYFTVNGVKQAAGQTFLVAANQLSTVRFVGSSVAGDDQVYVAAKDNSAWSNWTGFGITTSVGAKPIVSANNQTVGINQVITPAFSTTDANGDAITQYAFLDGNASSTSGYFTVNGVKQAAGQTFYVAANQLSTVKFVGGSVAGDDAVSVWATDSKDGWSNAKNFTITTKGAATDWFDQNIKDLAVRSLARSLFINDNSYSRDEIIKIFQQAGQGGTVDSNEFADLNKLVTDTSYIKMADYVRVLSQKVALGNVANNKYQGGSLGNLNANDSSIKLDKLLNKWFFGGDRPSTGSAFSYGSAAGVEYKFAQGALIQGGVNYQDVRQGVLGDCYLLAGLAEIALKTPNIIANDKQLFTDNGDNTYTVRFFNNQVADYVTVDRWLPTYTSNGTFAFASSGSNYNNSSNELWVALAEKAYAQINEEGWLGRGTDQYGNVLDGINSYKAIENGWMPTAIQQTTSRLGNGYYLTAAADVVNAFKAGKLVTFASKDLTVVRGTNVVSTHAYALVGYNDTTQKFTLFNPWGVNGGYQSGDSAKKDGFLELTWSQLQAYFTLWGVNN